MTGGSRTYERPLQAGLGAGRGTSQTQLEQWPETLYLIRMDTFVGDVPVAVDNVSVIMLHALVERVIESIS